MPISGRTRLLAILAIAVAIGTSFAKADEAEDFYRGKTVTIVLSNPPGGGYDLLARTIAPTLAKHIPGKPSVFMPYAGGMAHY